jgi:2-polyprenyl-3-methyl-5-hydroxy-6-metoxy-1,4-benzoquinol methylase
MFDWTKISSDPCDLEVSRQWQSFYNENIVRFNIFSKISRDELLMNLCGMQSSKIKLLDVGFAEHNLQYAKSPEWFHGKLRRLNQHEVFGLDNNAAAVRDIQQLMGLKNCIVGDATNSEFIVADGGFNAIHAGDVIEHLDNVGGFLRFCGANLAPSGRLVIITPNPCTKQIMSRSKSFGLQANMEHTSWITPTNMNELCRRHGFIFEESHYVMSKKPSLKSRLREPFIRRMKDVYFNEFIYVLSKAI